MKYVLVSGGVISGIGKGIIASSTGLILRSLGLSVTLIKIDPYLNVDAGTLSPTEHGEVFVLEDGGEVDLDLGNYERYLDISLESGSSITTGKIYQFVIKQERKGDYLGRTVQVVPHITDAIQASIERAAQTPVDDTRRAPDVCIIELGGTIGDIESAPFNEALRQLRLRLEQKEDHSFLHIFVSLVPTIASESKTKPTQSAVKESRNAGLIPDLIACRCSSPLERSAIEKIAMFCQVKPKQVLAVHDVESTYRVPMLLEKQGLDELLREGLSLSTLDITPEVQARGIALWSEWNLRTSATDHFLPKVNIALVGKYTKLHDSYLSIIKSLEHAAMACRRKLNLIWIDASDLEPESSKSSPAAYHSAWHKVCTAQGILIPGGFGIRGTEGMIAAAQWARTNKVPFLGICLGMQIAVIEFARHVAGIPNATSSEFDIRSTDQVVIPMAELDKEVMGGTMRLGLQLTRFEPHTEWSKLRALYAYPRPSLNVSTDLSEPLYRRATPSQGDIILERHRHRYEVNPAYIDCLTAGGLHFIGKDEKGVRMEILEIDDHPWFVGVQFHPEFNSRVLAPSRSILGFLAASAGCLEEVLGRSKSFLVNGMIDEQGDDETAVS